MKEKEIIITTWQDCGANDLIETWERTSALVITEAAGKEDNSRMLPLRRYKIKIIELT